MIHPKLLPLLVFLLACSGAVEADSANLATPADAGFQLPTGPEVQPPAGWHVDPGSSRQLGAAALVPDGSTFARPGTVMYAKVVSKTHVPEPGKSLARSIDEDIANFHEAYPGVEVIIEEPVLTADRQPLRTVTYASSTGGTWERVAYAENAGSYLLFVVSSRTRDGLDRAMPAFTAMVASYRVAA